MDKTKAILATFVITLALSGWLANSSIQSHLKTIGLLRSSIIEARHLLESPNKADIEYARVILENAQNSLERNGDEDIVEVKKTKTNGTNWLK